MRGHLSDALRHCAAEALYEVFPYNASAPYESVTTTPANAVRGALWAQAEGLHHIHCYPIAIKQQMHHHLDSEGPVLTDAAGATSPPSPSTSTLPSAFFEGRNLTTSRRSPLSSGTYAMSHYALGPPLPWERCP